jgi:hypothetical protein
MFLDYQNYILKEVNLFFFCGLTQSDGIVTVTPTSPESETIVNNQRIHETTTPRPGMTIRFGKLKHTEHIVHVYDQEMHWI